jgi:hypothetical protein
MQRPGREVEDKIKSLKRLNGSMVTSQKGLEEEAIGFYKSLFTTQEDMDTRLVTEWVVPKVDDAINEHLCVPNTDEEIERALFMMHQDRSP